MNEIHQSEGNSTGGSDPSRGHHSTGMESAEPQFLVHHNVAGTPATPKGGRATHICIFTSFTCRPLDTDNVCVKAALDHIRHENLIPDDNPEDLRLIIRQVKVSTVMEARTQITVLRDQRDGRSEGGLTPTDLVFDLALAGFDIEALYKTLKSVINEKEKELQEDIEEKAR